MLVASCLTKAFSQGLVAYYPFTGNTADSSGFGNTATVRGAKLDKDRFGVANRAFVFDGVQGGIIAPNSTRLNSDFTTVSFWVRPDALPAQGEAFLISFGGWQERFKISLPGHGKAVWTTNNESGISDMDAGGGNELAVGKWRHLVMVHDGSKDRIYLDGVQVGEKNVSGKMKPTVHPLGIGFDPIENANYFRGAIDEVMIYNRALTAAEITALNNAQKTAPVVAQGMVAEYLLDGNGRDTGPYRNDGVSNNTVTVANRFGFGSKAVRLNGKDAYVEVPNSSVMNSENATISFWVKVNALPAQGEVFLVSYGGWQERFKISLPSHGKVVFTTNHDKGISDMDAGGGNELPVGQWRHVVAVHDGAQDRIYINGALAASKNVVGKLNPTKHPLGIGYDPIDKGGYFNGEMDDVQLYNTALSQAQVTALYQAQSASPAQAGQLVAAYPFAGNLQDSSQFANHAFASAFSLSANRFGLANNALLLDGKTEVSASHSPVWNSPKTTISFWVNIKKLPAQGEVYLLSHGGWQERWKISLPGHGKPVFTTNHQNGISDMDSGTPLPVGAWKHVVMVHDGTKDKIFIDGALASEKNVAGDLKNTSYPLGIGYNPIDGGSYFEGSLDDIQLYNTALSDQQVKALFDAQKTAPAIGGTLVASYPFSGNAEDATAYRNHAVAEKAILDQDRFSRANQAYRFNGKDQQLTAANTAQLNSDFATVSFWVNVAALPAQGESFLLSFGGWQERWKISLPSHGKVVWTTNHENGISDMDAGSGNELPTGVWKHVALVHTGTQDKIFIDGKVVSTKNVAGKLKRTVHPLGIGFDPIDKGSYFNGRLDDIQIYGVALSDADVAALYAAQAAKPVVTDSVAPSVPLNLMAMVQNTQVNLSWLASTDNQGVSGYNVFQGTTKIGTTSATRFSIAGLPQLTAFTFGVSAVDAAGNESPQATVKATTGQESAPDTIAPTAPKNLTADIGSNSVILKWTASTDNRALAGYLVYVDGKLVDTLQATATSKFIGGLDPLTTYTFEVIAFDLAKNKSQAAELTVKTKAELNTGEPGLVAWYKFEGDARDATPYANHGAIGGNPVFEDVKNRPGAMGKALKFDGVGDSVLVPNAVQLISNYATVSFWVRVDGQNLADAEAYVLDFGHWDERWKVSLPQHLKIVWTTNSKNDRFDKSISDMDSRDGNELTKGFWWYVTMVHDGKDDIIYIDGKEANRKPAPGTLNSTARPFGMGSNPIEGKQYFIGALDEVKIYNKALTAAEIAKLYASGVTDVPDARSDLSGIVRMAYPNPAKDELFLEHRFPASAQVLLRVFDVQGKQLDAQRFQGGDGTFRLDVSQYPAGQYALNFVVDGAHYGTLQFVKQ
ncbi:MAG: hypothetical protein RL181_94 [Bacteroidota bacterium]